MATEILFGENVLENSGISSPNNVLNDADTTWAEPTSNNANVLLRISFATPSGDLNTGAGLQTFTLTCREAFAGQTGQGETRIELWEVGGGAPLLAGPDEDVTAESPAAGEEHTLTWDATLLALISGADCEIKVHGLKSGGSPSARQTVGFSRVKWDVDYTASGGSFFEAPNMAGLGTPALGLLVSYARSLSIAATGAPTLSRALSLSKDFSIAGAAGLTFANPTQHFRAHSFGGVGTVDEEHNTIVLVSPDMTGNAAVAFATQNFWDRQFNIAATGAPDISKQIAKILASAGLGSVAIAKGITIPRGYSGVGSVVSTQTQDVQVQPDMTGTGTVVVSTQTAFGQALTYTGNAAATIQKHIGKLFGFAGAGVTSFFHDGAGGGPVGRLILRTVIRPMLRLILREK